MTSSAGVGPVLQQVWLLSAGSPSLRLGLLLLLRAPLAAPAGLSHPEEQLREGLPHGGGDRRGI